eukprot:1140594-Pelagomonas_calceolata.AAC.3
MPSAAAAAVPVPAPMRVRWAKHLACIAACAVPESEDGRKYHRIALPPPRHISTLFKIKKKEFQILLKI